MSDIVERLTAPERRYRDADRHEARDEIVRLREALEDALQIIDDENNPSDQLRADAQDTIRRAEAAEAERDRLRARLDEAVVACANWSSRVQDAEVKCLELTAERDAARDGRDMMGNKWAAEREHRIAAEAERDRLLYALKAKFDEDDALEQILRREP